MKKSYYAHLLAGHFGSLDKIGGLPDHLPTSFPLSVHTGEEMAFLAQIYCDSERLPLPGVRCVQIYQIVEDYDPIPCVVSVPLAAMHNSNKLGRQMPGLLPYDISWVPQMDPDEFPSPRTYSFGENRFGDSKCGGITFFEGALEPGDSFLAQLREGPEGFKFGGYTAILVLDKQKNLQIRFG